MNSCVITETSRLASIVQRCLTVLIDAVSSTLNSDLYCVIVCHHHLKCNIVLSTIVDYLFGLKILGSVYSQITNFPANTNAVLPK